VFVTAFFAANPLSQLSLASSFDSTATRITPLSSSPQAHLDALKSFAAERDCTGEVTQVFVFQSFFQVFFVGFFATCG
jgi:hypothetical protein